MIIGMNAAVQMGAGAAMLITVAAIFLGLIILERWQNRRARRREAARQAAERERAGGAEGDSLGTAAAATAGGYSIWRGLFGPAAGEEEPHDPMQDVHPDELEGQYDGDPPGRQGL